MKLVQHEQSTKTVQKKSAPLYTGQFQLDLGEWEGGLKQKDTEKVCIKYVGGGCREFSECF